MAPPDDASSSASHCAARLPGSEGAMLTQVVAGNISGEATTLVGNILTEAMRWISRPRQTLSGR